MPRLHPLQVLELDLLDPDGGGRGLLQPLVQPLVGLHGLAGRGREAVRLQAGQAAVVEEQVGQAQVAVGDPGPVQLGDQAPDPPEDPVVEPLDGHVVQRAALEAGERQGQPAGVDLGDAEQPGGADAVAGRQRRHQRLVLDRLLQGGRDRLVAETAEAQPAVETEQQVAAALLVAEDLDEDAASVGRGAEERPGPAGVDRRRVDPGDVDAG
jgi:hypothetical protein